MFHTESKGLPIPGRPFFVIKIPCKSKRGAAIGRPRLPLLIKGGAPRSELEY